MRDIKDAAILIVDDEAVIRTLMGRVLERGGFTKVTQVGCAGEALEALGLKGTADSGPVESPPFPPHADIVLLDVVLPDESGFEVCKRIKQAYPTLVPVLLVSGFRLEDTHARITEAGADDFLGKPFGVQELLTRVSMLLQRKMRDEASQSQQTQPRSPAIVHGSDGLPRVGDQIGRFVVEEILWWGGVSFICKVRDVDHSRKVLKFLARGVAEHKDVVQRFAREIKIVKQFNHPNVVRVYDDDVHGDFPYYTMEYVPGPDMETVLRRDKVLDASVIFQTAEGVAAALRYIHGHGVVHRDITLRNIIQDPRSNSVKLTDFGIAMSMGQTRITQHGCAVGTPLYMAPEMFEGVQPSPATDIYSYGACLYHLVVGTPPFTATSTVELARKHASRPAEPLTTVRPNVPLEWNEFIVTRCMAKDPNDRPQEMASVFDTLASLWDKAF